MSAFATTLASTIGDITTSLDQENLYNPLNVLKDEAAKVYGKMVEVIRTQFPGYLLSGTASGIAPTTQGQLYSINEALASLDRDGTGTQSFVELKMIMQLYADLLHQIAEGTLSSSAQNIEDIRGYAKKLADLFDNMITNGINIIKRIKGYAPGNYRYLKKYLFSDDQKKNPDDLDLAELDDSIVPLVIYNVRNKIKNDSMFWDTGKYSPEDQTRYLLECMKAVEIKQAIERRELPNAPIKDIVDMTDRIHAKSGKLTMDTLQKPDGLNFIAKIEEIISEKRDELKSLDDDPTIYAADLIQADYYKPGEFFHNILRQIFTSLRRSVPKKLNIIADKLDAKIVKSLPLEEDKPPAVLPMMINGIVGARDEATPTTSMFSTHPYRGVSLRSIKARSFLKRVLRIAIFKFLPAHILTEIPSDIERLSQRIKSKRIDILLDFEITGMQLDILIGWQRDGLIKLITVSKNFFSDIDVLFKKFKGDNNIDTLMLLFRKIHVAIKDVEFINPNTVKDIKKNMMERVMSAIRSARIKPSSDLDLNKIKLMNRIIKELNSFIQSETDLMKAIRSKREALIAASGARGEEAASGARGEEAGMNVEARGGKRNTKKQKKNQKKKTMKAPHKRTIKKRKRRKNKTSKNRS